jgi:hypothetical protein
MCEDAASCVRICGFMCEDPGRPHKRRQSDRLDLTRLGGQMEIEREELQTA